MLDQRQIEEYLAGHGIPVTRPIYQDGQKLRVMDLTSLPASMRDYFDERGFLKTSEAPKAEEQHEEAKGGKKNK